MSETPNLALPLIAAGQAQKHVTHNEAVSALDALVQLAVISRAIDVPPATPAEGARYIVPAGASGEWAGWGDAIAVFEAGAWRRIDPRAGFVAWCEAEAQHLRFDGTWSAFGVAASLPLLGVNATADTQNRLAVSSPAALFNHAGSGMQVKVNKQTAGDTASLLYQTGFSGRAEMGLAGDDDFHVKVSADGGIWHEALTIAAAGGQVNAQALAVGGSLANAVRNGRITAIELARLKGDIVELDLGLADGFATPATIDAAASLNEEHVAGGSFWRSTSTGGVFDDLTLRGNAYALPFIPQHGHVLLLVRENSIVAANTDLVMRLSRDGGANLATLTLAFQRARADGLKLYEAVWADLAGPPTGASLVWQVETANQKNIEIHGIAVQVS